MAVGDVQVGAHFFHCLFEAANLAVREGNIFRSGREVRVHSLDAQVFEVCQPGSHFCHGVRKQTGSPHARIHIDMQVDLLVV